MLYTYIVNNNNNFSIEENEFSYKDNLNHFRFNFAQNKKDFMIRTTLERLTLFQALKNVGSIIPLILSIHTFVLALVIPGMFERKV